MKHSRYSLALLAAAAVALFAPSVVVRAGQSAPAIDAFNAAFSKVTSYTFKLHSHETKGSSVQQRVYDYSFMKPHFAKTLIESFRYPRRGPGMMWELCTQKIQALGGEVRLGHRVTGCRFDAARNLWIVTTRDASGRTEEHCGEHMISSMPMRELVQQIEPTLSDEVSRAGQSLRYRDFVTVGLIVRDQGTFSDNWIYIHDPSVQVGRVQNYKSWSPEMVPDPAYSSYGLEYFCFEDDRMWSAPDAELIELAKKEIQQINLARAADVVDGCVIRQRKAYPVYDDAYQKHVETIRVALEKKFPTLHLVGRNGMHKYNNQDHAMMTAMLTAKNILAGERKYDVWAVNQDAEYHESGVAGERPEDVLRGTPIKTKAAAAGQN